MCCPVCELVHIKYPLLQNKKSSQLMGTAGFLILYLSELLPYVQCHITVNVLSVLLKKTLPFIRLQEWVQHYNLRYC